MILSDLYKMQIAFQDEAFQIKLLMLTPYVNTSKLNHTYSFFEKNLPSILRSKCYNESNYPFYREIINTELGHLFEHMLLENLCKQKLLHGHKKATFAGNTSWNWKEEKMGVFNITINIKNEDRIYLNAAMKETIDLFQKLLNNNSIN
jgi:hypothetical protein